MPAPNATAFATRRWSKSARSRDPITTPAKRKPTAAAQAVEADRAAITAKEQKIAEARSLVVQREAQIEAARIAPQQVADARAKSDSAGGHLEQARADLHTAQLNLSYTKIYAPVSGVIGRKTVELGHRVQPGQSLAAIVPLDDIWITANFKETQLKTHATRPIRHDPRGHVRTRLSRAKSRAFQAPPVRSSACFRRKMRPEIT